MPILSFNRLPLALHRGLAVRLSRHLDALVAEDGRRDFEVNARVPHFGRSGLAERVKNEADEAESGASASEVLIDRVGPAVAAIVGRKDVLTPALAERQFVLA